MIIIINNIYKVIFIFLDMETLYIIILASFLISLVSFSGAVLFIWREKAINKYLILFVALAAGSLLGTAFFHLIPESVELYENTEVYHEADIVPETNAQADAAHEDEHNHFFLPSYFILLGILLFYVIEKFIHWHHHHDIDCHKHSLSSLSLIGDGLHNFLDGALIAAAFFVDIRLGIVTTIAIALHEIPQEIGNLAILLHSGMNKFKALLWNFLTALTSVLGAVLMYFFIDSLESSIPLIIALTAGTFIYLSLADIIPELNSKRHKFSQGLITIVFLLGIGLSLLMTFIGH
jgi:zinc and cadmium transporter